MPIGTYNITATSTPDYDEWFWDDYWACTDWIKWWEALKAEYGEPVARNVFLPAWEKSLTIGSYHADCVAINAAFRSYFDDEQLLPLMYGNYGFLIQPAGSVVDLYSGASDVVSGAGDVLTNVADASTSITKQLKWILPVVLTLAAVGGGFYLYKRYG